MSAPAPPRPTQAQRRARSRAALLEATASAISRSGYGNLSLIAVADDAGYSRGALYHQFDDKDALVLATIDWVRERWYAEVAPALDDGDRTPVERLVELARRHAVFCRRDIAGVMAALRIEFAGREHPIGDAVNEETEAIISLVSAIILAGRRQGDVPPGPPAAVLARAGVAAVEHAVIALSGRRADDEQIAERIIRGLIGAGQQ
jgi:AcrR family transcriptional regulator